jgi:ferredoxin
LNGKTFDALSADFYYIVPEKCTECVGHFDQEQCAAVCPVDCCVPDGDHAETEDQLMAKAKLIHPEKQFGELTAANSRFRK